MAIKPDWFDPQMLVGVTLHGYHLKQFLGSGGFGAVYLTADTQGELRALKVLFPPHSLGNEDIGVWEVRANNFRREALIAAGFRHPNIVRVFDTLQTNWPYRDPLSVRPGHFDLSGSYPLHFYVAEFLPDGVEQRLKDGGLFPPEEALQVAAQTCDALEALHSADPQVLHRDLNPGNVRLAEGGRVVITDFGVARTEGLPRPYVDQEGPIFHRGIGAPEQWAGELADVRTDIFQLGALLLKMLTGKYPREGGVSVLEGRKDILQGLSSAILRCLEEDRALRFQSVLDLKEALKGDFLIGKRLHKLWEISLRSPNWRTRITPASENEDGCLVWDRHTLLRLDPGDGATIWSWTDQQDGGRSAIPSSLRNPTVQSTNQLVFVGQGNLLSCLRYTDGALRWEYQSPDNSAGHFLLVQDLVVLDSYCPQEEGLFGLVALNSSSGELVWFLEEPNYHVASMTMADDTLVLVEYRGLRGRNGLRVRLVDLSRGKTLAVHNLYEPGNVSSDASRQYVHDTERIQSHQINAWRQGLRLRHPLVMSDGSIVLWSSDGLSPHSDVFCFDSQLTLTWSKFIQISNERSARVPSGNSFMISTGEHLLAFQADYGDDRNIQRCWVANVDPQTGELGDIVELPENGVAFDAALSPDRSAVYLTTLHRETNKKGVPQWRLLSLSPDIEDLAFLGPEGNASGGLMPLTPVATHSRIYIQVPPGESRGWERRTGSQRSAAIVAFQRI